MLLVAEVRLILPIPSRLVVMAREYLVGRPVRRADERPRDASAPSGRATCGNRIGTAGHHLDDLCCLVAGAAAHRENPDSRQRRDRLPDSEPEDLIVIHAIPL